jgi:hypothetical protein
MKVLPAGKGGFRGFQRIAQEIPLAPFVKGDSVISDIYRKIYDCRILIRNSENTMSRKPLGHKNYGSISHLPGSRLGSGDHKCHEGQEKIACRKARDKHDRIIVQEKLDGSNVGIARIDDILYPLTRAGYVANTSPYKMHHIFYNWVFENTERFMAVLKNGERLCGEWLSVAHGTLYDLPHEPFVVFDIMTKKHNRMPFDEFTKRCSPGEFVQPHPLSDGPPLSIEDAMKKLKIYGFHGAKEPAEGAVWRVERNVLNDAKKGNAHGRHYIVDFLVKYVRTDKEDGKYLKKDEILYNKHM